MQIIPPPWCPPRRRWSCCFHWPSQPMLEGTWCWPAMDNNDRAWSRKGKRFHYLALQSPSSETSYLSDAQNICPHLEQLHPKKSPRRVDGGMFICETRTEGILPVAENSRKRRRGCLVGSPHPAFYGVAVSAAVTWPWIIVYEPDCPDKRSVPCPSRPALWLSGGDGAVSAPHRAGRSAVHGADWGRCTVRCCCINLSLKGKVHPKADARFCAGQVMLWRWRWYLYEYRRVLRRLLVVVHYHYNPK